MTPPAPSLLRCLFLGLSALVPPTFTKLQLQVAPGFSNLRVVEGSDVVLPVWYTKLGQESPDPSWKVLSAIWYLQKKDEKTKQVLAYFSTSNVIKESRVSLIYPMPSHNLSLRLENLQEQDSGFYYCSVNVEGNKDFKDHDSSKMVELNVLIPPAPPSCTLQGVPRAGANVTLSCQSPRSKPPAQYQWTGPSLYTKTFSPRFLDMVRGFLNLTNLSTSMSGVYVCKAHNEVGSAQCNVTMEVSSGPEPAVVAGAVVGTLLGLGLLVGLVLLFQRHQGKNVEEPANDIKEDATAPRTLPWPKGSDTISKNGTLSSVTSARALRSHHGPPRPGALTPSPSLSSQAVPSPILPSLAKSSPILPRTDEAQAPQASLNHSGVSSSTLTRMGGVPIMVPAQSQAGSLV